MVALKVNSVAIQGLMYTGTVAVYGVLQLVLAFGISALYSPASAGAYFLALAIVTPSSLFVGFRLRDDLLVNPDRDMRLYLTARAIGLAILWTFAPLVFTLLAGWSDLAVCLGVLTFKSSELVADISYGERQLRQDYVGLCLSLGCRGLVGFTVFVVAAFGGLSLETALLLQAGSSWGIVAGFDLRPLIGRALGVTFLVQSGALLGVFRRTLPLALATLGLSISQHGPRLVIGSLGGVESLGRVAPTLVSVAAWAWLMQTVGEVLLPRLARGSQRVKHLVDFALRHALGLAAITGTIASLGGYVVNEVVLDAFVSDEAPSGTFVATAFFAFGPLSVTALARVRVISAGAYSVVATAGWSAALVALAVSAGLFWGIGSFAAAVALVAASSVQATVLVENASRLRGSS